MVQFEHIQHINTSTETVYRINNSNNIVEYAWLEFICSIFFCFKTWSYMPDRVTSQIVSSRVYFIRISTFNINSSLSHLLLRWWLLEMFFTSPYSVEEKHINTFISFEWLKIKTLICNNTTSDNELLYSCQ